MIHMLTPTKFDDVIDSRDVVAALKLDDLDSEYREALESLAKQCETAVDDFRYGLILIRDSYFQTYAQEVAEDSESAFDRLTDWPYTCIDWAKAANELQVDYTPVTFDDVTYWVR